MLSKPVTCLGCPLYDLGEGFSTPEGLCSNGVLILGEALGKNEKFDGKPFRPYAESGSVLEAAFSRLGLNRMDFGLYNIVNCQPPANLLEGQYYEEDAASHCNRYVLAAIKKFKPKVILALGSIGMKYTWAEYNKLVEEGNTIDDKKQRQAYFKKLRITSTRGYFVNSLYNIPVIASLHPSFIRRTEMVYLGVLIRDIRLAVLAAQSPFPEYTLKYEVNPSEEAINNFISYAESNPTSPIVYDIETPFSILEADEKDIDYIHQDVRDIDSIQVEIKEGESLFLTLGKDKELNPNWEIAKKILDLPNPKVGHNNWEFDQLNIQYHLGKEYPKGVNIDGMWMAKWWNQDFGASKLASHGLGLQWTTSLLNENFPLWKHLSNKDEFYYGCLDVDATLRNFNILKKEFLSRRLDKDAFGNEVKLSKNMFDGFMDDIVYLNPILKAASLRGFPVNVKERKEYKKKLKAEILRVNDELQNAFPNHLRRRDPLLGFRNIPQEVQYLENIIGKAFNFTPESPFILPGENGGLEVADEIKQEVYENVVEKLTRTKEGMSGLVIRKFKLENGVEQDRWCRLHTFKVGSKDQVLAYVNYKGYKIKQKKDGRGGKMKYTTSKDVVHQLWEETKDKFLGNIIYLRELNKLASTYLGTGDFSFGKDGKIVDVDEDLIGVVHTVFGYWPVTGQLSSKRPNIQNLPKYGGQYASPQYRKLAKDYRKIIQAKRGHLLLEADYKSFHALTLAFEAEDADYMRLVRADVHSFVAAHIIRNEFTNTQKALKGKLSFKGANSAERTQILAKLDEINKTLEYLKDLDNWLKYPDEKLIEKLKWIKKNYEFVRNRQAKPGILGLGYGMGAKRLYEENVKSFKNPQDAGKVITLLQKLFPKLFEFHKLIRKQADTKGFLLSRYGYLERFYNVFDYRVLKENRSPRYNEEIFRGRDGRLWSKTPGSDSENAIAFYPANDAFGKIKEAMRELDEIGAMEKYKFVNQIHDSLIFHCPENLIEECAKVVKEVMERPAKYLVNKIAPNGLLCAVDISVGKNWAGYHEKENPEGLKEI